MKHCIVPVDNKNIQIINTVQNKRFEITNKTFKIEGL